MKRYSETRTLTILLGHFIMNRRLESLAYGRESFKKYNRADANLNSYRRVPANLRRGQCYLLNEHDYRLLYFTRGGNGVKIIHTSIFVVINFM